MKQTALYQAHVKKEAKICNFAGFAMPIQYDKSIVNEHNWVRSSAGIFDVSHMGQVIIKGANATKFIEKITPSFFQNTKLMNAKYTVLTNEKGGIVDDLIVAKIDENEYYVVVNGACKDNDLKWMLQHVIEDVEISLLDKSLIALQGPKSEQVLSELINDDIADLYYMNVKQCTLKNGNEIIVSRVGYTGEDGFEISIGNEDVEELWHALLKNDHVKPIGLAARDSLRLEMGYALYGHDMNEETTPIEAGIGWVVSKNNTGFIGAEIVHSQKRSGTAKLRKGIMLLDKGIARENTVIEDVNGQEIGYVTSGSFIPSLEKSVAVGYLPASYNGNIMLVVRGRKIRAEIIDLPFTPAKTKIRKKT